MGCSAIVEGELIAHEWPLIVGVRVSTAADGWEAVDAVQLCGYAQSATCKFGGRTSPIIWLTPTLVSCFTPSHAPTPLLVHGTASSGPANGQSGFFYPLYLSPPRRPHHVHTFREHEGVAFYMSDEGARHAEISIDTAYTHTLMQYTPSTFRATSLVMGLDGAISDDAISDGEISDGEISDGEISDSCLWSLDGV